jgi:small subunit ribosomal protein S7
LPRRGSVPKREILPDPVYRSKVLTKLINQVMLDGKKSLAETLVYRAMDIIKEKSGKNPLEVFEAAMKNIMPILEVKARRVGGANYQVPIEVRHDRRQTLAIRWLTKYSRERAGRTMEERLASEIMDAAAGAGASAKKREDTHKMAEANKAFAHYRW